MLEVAALVVHEGFAEDGPDVGVEEHFLVLCFEAGWSTALDHKGRTVDVVYVFGRATGFHHLIGCVSVEWFVISSNISTHLMQAKHLDRAEQIRI